MKGEKLMLNDKKCGNCALWQQNNGLCPVFKMSLKEEENACPAYINSNKEPCEICGHLFISPGFITADDKGIYHIYCDNCASEIGNCSTCINSQECSFNNDTSCPLPQMVMKTIRQGNAVIQSQVPNPERIRETCQKVCPCYSSEFGCLKQNNCCSDWKAPWERGE